jgi:recombinational DNA repair ATPase RecF
MLQFRYEAIWQPKKSIIKESRGNGEIVGLTRKKSALIRWTLTLHVLGRSMAAYRKHFVNAMTTNLHVLHECFVA